MWDYLCLLGCFTKKKTFYNLHFLRCKHSIGNNIVLQTKLALFIGLKRSKLCSQTTSGNMKCLVTEIHLVSLETVKF